MLYIIRHGQRSDIGNLKEFVKMKKDHDPHLTSIGEFMSYKTGDGICEEHDYEKFPLLMISSPYLRCIQTAENILKGIEFVKNKHAMQDNTIFLEDSLRELQSSEAYVKPENYWTITSMDQFSLSRPDMKSFTLDPPRAEPCEGRNFEIFFNFKIKSELNLIGR